MGGEGLDVIVLRAFFHGLLPSDSVQIGRERFFSFHILVAVDTLFNISSATSLGEGNLNIKVLLYFLAALFALTTLTRAEVTY